MQYTKLEAVTPDSQHWTVKVRVVRFNEYTSEDTPPRVLRMDMVLLDEEVHMLLQ